MAVIGSRKLLRHCHLAVVHFLPSQRHRHLAVVRLLSPTPAPSLGRPWAILFSLMYRFS